MKKKKPRKVKQRKPRAKPVRIHKSDKRELLEKIDKIEIGINKLRLRLV